MSEHEAIIVGAGFGGMGAAIQLDRLGIEDYLIVDREDDLGGTWHVNHYPGLAVDIASVTYQYSFEPNPHWSRLYAPGAELKQYATHVADSYDLKRRMRFNTKVTGAEWDDASGRWTVEVDGGETLTAKYLITATGFLSQPKKPDIDGVDSFAGKVIHSADWDHDYDLAGKRVAVIGTGATGVQLIPELAKEAADLTVYQRTPIWVVPKFDGAIPWGLRQLFQRLPFTQRLARYGNSTVLEAITFTGVLHYKQAAMLNRIAESLAKTHLRRQVKDAETRRQLTPDYSLGCKRPTFSNDYYPAFNEPHVHLQTTPIARVEPDGIVTGDGQKNTIDVLVLATGFDLWDTNFPAIQIRGRDGRDLGKWWRENRFQAYEGITVPQFPNLLSITSPYSYTGLSYFWTIEAQMKHMDRLFGELSKREAEQFEVKQEANDGFLERMTDRLGDSVFYQGNCASARSYYYDPNGEATLLRPSSVAAGHRDAVSFPVDDYHYA